MYESHSFPKCKVKIENEQLIILNNDNELYYIKKNKHAEIMLTGKGTIGSPEGVKRLRDQLDHQKYHTLPKINYKLKEKMNI